MKDGSKKSFLRYSFVLLVSYHLEFRHYHIIVIPASLVGGASSGATENQREKDRD